MNPIEQLCKDLIERFPHLSIKLDIPANRSGHWHLDVQGHKWIVIEWRDDFGFGVSAITEDSGYGMKPDEIYIDPQNVIGRVEEMLSNENAAVDVASHKCGGAGA